MKNKDLEKYYAQRASEYDLIYMRPERQADLSQLQNLVSSEFKGLDVLEIACGTGYWTQYIAKSAKSITATDINLEMLHCAYTRDYRNCYLSFGLADAFLLSGIDSKFSGGFAGFFWSHVPIQRRVDFLKAFHSHMMPGATVVMIDNRYVEGNSTPVSYSDEIGNTYQIRKLKDNSTHQVLKNFPSPEELRQNVAPFAAKLSIHLLTYFWLITWRVK